MRFIFHLLGILFFLIWIAIGAAIVAGAILLFVSGPGKMVSGMLSGNNLGGLGGITALMGQSGGLSGITQKLTEGKGIKEEFSALPKTQQDCLNKELGDKTVSDALAGKIQPSPDLIFKAMKCLK